MKQMIRWRTRAFSASQRLCALVLAGTSAVAAEPLVWKWAEGDTQRYLLTQSVEIAIDGGEAGKVEKSARQQTLVRWIVESVEADGTATIEQRVDRVLLRTQGPAGSGYRYDSADESPPLGLGAMLAPMFEARIAEPTFVSMAPSGDVRDVEFSEDFATALKRLPGGALSSDLVRQTVERGLAVFPEGELSAGQKWEQRSTTSSPQAGEIDLITTLEYAGPKEIDGRSLESITLAQDVEAGGVSPQGFTAEFDTQESEGELLFDREAGRLVRSDLSTTFGVVTFNDEVSSRSTVTQVIAIRALGPDESPEWDESLTAEPGDE